MQRSEAVVTVFFSFEDASVNALFPGALFLK
jgi:hypothetical protein